VNRWFTRSPPIGYRTLRHAARMSSFLRNPCLYLTVVIVVRNRFETKLFSDWFITIHFTTSVTQDYGVLTRLNSFATLYVIHYQIYGICRCVYICIFIHLSALIHTLRDTHHCKSWTGILSWICDASLDLRCSAHYSRLIYKYHAPYYLFLPDSLV